MDQKMNHSANKIIFILAALLLLSACAAPKQLTEASKNKIKKVAIVSLVSESVNFDRIGVSSFTSKHTEFDMGKKVTDAILFVSKERIAQIQPGWTVKSIEYDQAALFAKVNFQSGYQSSLAKEAFADLARDNDLDAIFVVRAAAEQVDVTQVSYDRNPLREGLSVLIKDDFTYKSARLIFRANLSVAIIGRNGEVMALGAAPAALDKTETREPDDYDVSNDMKHNHRPEILQKIGAEVVVDLARRLNYCFDTLGFVENSKPAADQHVKVVPQAETVTAPKETSPAQAAPAADSFDQCFSRCRQYTDRSKEQCFDACKN
jgi:hypothetical protein